jgi:hypothetical protein
VSIWNEKGTKSVPDVMRLLVNRMRLVGSPVPVNVRA